MKLYEEEIIELIDMHGRTLVEMAMCDGCGQPIKAAMIRTIDRMRELIDLLPDHDAPHEEDDDSKIVPMKPKGKNLQ